MATGLLYTNGMVTENDTMEGGWSLSHWHTNIIIIYLHAYNNG